MDKRNFNDIENTVTLSRIYNIIFRLRFQPLALIYNSIFLQVLVFSYETVISGSKGAQSQLKSGIENQMNDILVYSSNSLIQYNISNYNKIDSYLSSLVLMTNTQNWNSGINGSDSNLKQFSSCNSNLLLCYYFDSITENVSYSSLASTNQNYILNIGKGLSYYSTISNESAIVQVSITDTTNNITVMKLLRSDVAIDSSLLWKKWQNCQSYCNYNSSCNKTDFKFGCYDDIKTFSSNSGTTIFPSINYSDQNISPDSMENSVQIRYCKADNTYIYCAYFKPDIVDANGTILTKITKANMIYDYENNADTNTYKLSIDYNRIGNL